jgi:hypothetical protein
MIALESWPLEGSGHGAWAVIALATAIATRTARRTVRHLEKVKVDKSKKHQVTPETEVPVSANYAKLRLKFETQRDFQSWLRSCRGASCF